MTAASSISKFVAMPCRSGKFSRHTNQRWTHEGQHPVLLAGRGGFCHLVLVKYFAHFAHENSKNSALTGFRSSRPPLSAGKQLDTYMTGNCIPSFHVILGRPRTRSHLQNVHAREQQAGSSKHICARPVVAIHAPSEHKRSDGVHQAACISVVSRHHLF